MSDTVIVALISLLGTLGGSLCGVIASGKLTSYRIQQLEKRVEEHNNLVSRMYAVEKHEALLDEEIEQLRSYHR